MNSEAKALAGSADEPPSMLDAALRYADAYKIRVFPCGGADGKEPLTKHGFKDACTDPEQIRRWWTAHPNANIGLACGNGWWVLDVDGEEGERSLAEIVKTRPLFTTQVQTGNGRHFYFRGQGPRTGAKLRPGLDVRSEGGYVIAPPSLHVASGKRYQWTVEPDQMTEAPPWLIAALGERHSAAPNHERLRGAGEAELSLSETEVRLIQSALLALSHFADHYNSWIEIGMALQWTRAGQQAFDLWHQWSKRSAKYVDEADCWKHWKSFGRREVEVTLGSLFHHAEAAGWTNPADLPLPPPGISAVGQAYAAERSPILVEFEKGPRGWSKTKPAPRRVLVRQMDDSPLLIPGRIVGMAAAGGAGKTSSAILLGISFATGRPWFGAFKIESGAPRRTLLLLGEDDEEGAHQAVWNACEGLELSDEERQAVDENMVAIPLAGHPCALATGDVRTREITVTSHFKAVISILNDEAKRLEILGVALGGFELIVVDTLARFGPGEIEIDNGVATRFVQALERLAKCPGNPCVLVCGHTPKAGRSIKDAVGFRGSTAIDDSLRCVLNLVADGKDAVTLSGIKCNYAPVLPDTRLVRKNGILRVETSDEAEAREAGTQESQQQKEVSKRRNKSGAKDTATRERREEILPDLLDVVRSEPGIIQRELAASVDFSRRDAEEVITHAVAQQLLVTIPGKYAARRHYIPSSPELVRDRQEAILVEIEKIIRKQAGISERRIEEKIDPCFKGHVAECLQHAVERDLVVVLEHEHGIGYYLQNSKALARVRKDTSKLSPDSEECVSKKIPIPLKFPEPGIALAGATGSGSRESGIGNQESGIENQVDRGELTVEVASEADGLVALESVETDLHRKGDERTEMPPGAASVSKSGRNGELFEIPEDAHPWGPEPPEKKPKRRRPRAPGGGA